MVYSISDIQLYLYDIRQFYDIPYSFQLGTLDKVNVTCRLFANYISFNI